MSVEQLIQFLRRQAGVNGGSARVPAAQLVDGLGISRPTLMRTVKAAGPAVIAMGQTRRRAYAARRPLRGSMVPLPVFQITPEGEPHQVGQLHLAHGHGCWFEGAFPGWPLDASDSAMRDGWFEGLPYPLQDMRPEGFLGRSFARAHAPLLQVSEDPREWSDDDTLHALSLLGSDTVGDLIIGEAAYQRWAQRRLGNDSTKIAEHDRPQAYLKLAEAAMTDGTAGSSAAGEFPKFPAVIHRTGTGPQSLPEVQHVLVKFSGSDDSPGSRRWADLLVCEHLALQALAGLGLRTAASRILQAGGRTFLELDRFDRHGAFGRSPMCSWQVIGNTFLGDTSGPWPDAGTRLRQRGLIARSDTQTIDALALMWHFGKFIQNTDMHAGNLSFVPVNGQLQVAPAYDMLPMHHAPVRGVELPVRPYEVRLPLPAAFGHARLAATAAEAFWDTASRDVRISEAFRAVCAQSAEEVRRLRGVMDR